MLDELPVGDFNIDRRFDANWKAFVIENGLRPPDELFNLARTVGDTTDQHSYFDHIAWFNDGQHTALTLEYWGNAGAFIWDKYLLEDVPIRRKEARISDHYPYGPSLGFPRHRYARKEASSARS